VSLPGAGAEERWIDRVIDGRYRIVALLGNGGMGSVYEAEHLALGKRVAFKVIHRDLVSDEEALARFEREARATAAIEHPHVASAMDFGRLEGGGAYLVVQLVHGLSLRQRIEAGPIAWREACAIGAQIADALQAIHARGFVHRDLTSDNVLLTTNEDGSPFVHVLDLGVAGVVKPEGSDARLTEEGHVVGTPGYMSPEQALGKPTDPRTDLYALGVLLWEMCTGRSLWGSRELTQIVASQLTEEPPPIPQLASATAPMDLTLLILRLLSRAPADRPSDALHVRDALRRFGTMSAVIPVIRRYRAPATLIAGGALAMLALVAVTAIGLVVFEGDAPSKTPPPSIATVTAATPRSGEALTPEVSALVMTMSSGRYRHQRHAAAEALLQAGAAPAWARAAAELELGRTCGSRRAELARLRELGRPETLPVIERMRAAPRTGCGRGRRSDCYGCVREDLELAYRAAGGSEQYPRP
jgi:serine/threonine-protein kinase